MPITLDFAGKLAVVTGGGRGIGLAIAKALAEGGADVAITYTSKDAAPVADELSRTYGTRVKAFKCEVTVSAEVDAAVTAIEAAYGQKVDIGVANAGISLWKEATETSDDEFRKVLEVNTVGPFFFARALARSWLDLPVTAAPGEAHVEVPRLQGRQLDKQILIVSSISGIVAMNPQRQTAYNASKGAATMLAKSLAGEWAHLGIAVNAVSPGYVATDMITGSASEEDRAYAAEWQKRTPVGRFATPDEIGGFIATLLSAKQGGMGFMTGSDIVIDGGYTIF
ncbi:hypothetical protein Q5752_004589 [Cryptotrichosporon argae]